MTAKSDELPSELIQKFGHYLSKNQVLDCILTCKHWCFALLPVYYKSTEIRTCDWDRIKGLVSRPKRLYSDFRKYIRELVIFSPVVHYKLHNIRSLVQGMTGLMKLDLVNVGCLTDDDIWLLSSNCKFLQHLSILASEDNRITDEALVSLSRNSPQLRHLFLTCTSASLFTSRGFNAIADGFESKLASFSLEIISITHQSLPDSGLRNISNALPFVNLQAENQPKTGQALANILQKHLNLRHVSLDWPFGMEDCLQALQDQFELKSLHLGNLVLKDSKIIHQNPLEELVLFECKLDPLVIESLGTKQMKSLELRGTANVDIIAGIAMCFTNLVSLVFNNSFHVAVHRCVTDQQMLSIASHCPQLKKLHLPIATDQSLVSLSEHCLELQDLDVIDGKMITNQGLTLFVTRCRKLQKIYLGRANQITEVGIQTLAQYNRQLDTLFLPAGAQISDNLVPVLADRCVALKVLGNVVWSIDSLEVQIPLLKNLQMLYLLPLRGLGDPFLPKHRVELLKKTCLRLYHISYL
ncbi:hypothetical protein EDD86DRAFT_198251 [Gorgonomyces haynaldii]|nr:hypothetical protein EDD86DRAFT_198251 [Gorgonomyces haynaldii]